MDIKKIGFMGIGVMGEPMATHLLQAGYKVNVFTRTKSKANHLLELGATWCDTPAECAKDCDLVISIVGYPADVKAVWMGENGAFYSMKKGAIGVDMTTSTPSLAIELHAKAQELGLHMADCPITGGDIGARNASLTMLFGGEREIFDGLMPVFKVIGKRFEYFGEAGKGQLAKACNQIAVAATMFSACEAVLFAQTMHLDPMQIINTLTAGAASSFSLQSYGPRIVKGDYEPGFKIKHFIKDMKIALDVAKEHNLNLIGVELAVKTYEILEKNGLGEVGTQALYKYYLHQFDK